MTRLMLLLCIAASLRAAELTDIRTDPNLERRAHVALAYAAAAFEQAKSAYAAGDVEKTAKSLTDMQAGVETARDALDATHKNPRRHVGPFKKAETETRELLRRLEGLENNMAVEDRKLIEVPKAKVQEVHDEWLNEIISGKH